MDLLAYHRITHGTDSMRALTSQPATLNDLLSMLLLSRGNMTPLGSQQPQPKRHRSPRAAPVTVHGGQSTAHMRKIADDWHTTNMPKDWAKTTGSSPEAIAWLMSGD